MKLGKFGSLVAAVSAALYSTFAFGFDYSSTITASGYTGEETLRNFPVLVKISPETIKGFAYEQLQQDGKDILFTSLDESVTYPFEIDTWDTTGTSFVWVKLPALTKTTQFKFRWGDGAIGASAANAHEVWAEPTGGSDVSYAGVWHMGGETGSDEKDSATTRGDVDMTAHAYVSDNGDVDDMLSVAGKIGAARQTDKKTQTKGCHFLVDNYPLQDVGNVFTVSLWYYYISGSWHPIITTMACENARGGSGWMFRGLSGRYYFYNNGSSIQSSVNPGTKQWAHCVAVFDGANKSFKMYVNGQLTGSNTGWANAPSTAANHPLSFGHFTVLDGQWSGDGMYGYLDEIRVMKNGAASGDWVKAEYDTVATDGFLVYSDAKQQGSNELTITATPEEIGAVSPDYGLHTDMPIDDLYLCTAQEEDIVYDETHHGSFTGWSLYEMNGMGEWVLKDSDDVRAYAHYQKRGMSYKLVWQISDIYRVAVNASSHGSVDLETAFYRAGSDVMMTATPEAGAKFVGWTGVPDGKENENPLLLTVDGPINVVANFVTDDGRLDIDLTSGDQTVLVGPGETYTVENVVGNPAAKLTIAGGGSLILPDQDLSAAFAELIVKDTTLTISSDTQLGAGAVTVENGGFVVTSDITLSRNAITVTPGTTATIVIPEGVTFTAAAAKFITKSATLIKTGLGVFKTTDTLASAQVSSSTWICEQGDILIYGKDEEKTHVIEMHEGTRLRQGLNVYNLSMYATVCLRGAQYVLEDPYNSINSNVAQDLLHFSTAHFGLGLAKSVGDAIMGFKALASEHPSTITFDAPLLSVGAVPFEVEDGAVLNLDANLRGDGVGYVAGIKKTGAGTLRLLQSPYDRCVVSVDEGTLALAGHNVRLGNKATVTVADGARIVLENGGVLDSVGGANANALIAEASVRLDAQALADEYADSAPLYAVANLGPGGGVFTRYSASGFLSFGTSCVSGKPGFWCKTTASTGLGGAGQISNTGSEVSIYLVCDPNLANFTFTDEQHGKNSSPIWFTKNGVNDDSTREGAFRYNYDAANKFRIYFQGNDAEPLTIESDDVALSKGAFIDCIRRDATTASFLRWYSDSDEFSTNLVDQAYKNFNFFNCSIDAKMKSTGNIWQNNTCPMNLGEVLVFTRKLTDEEDRAVRGYLAKKWFNSAATWPELPKAGAKKDIAVSVDAGHVGVLGLDLAEGEQMIKIVKEGEGTLVSVSSLSNSSEVVVKEGVLAFDSVDAQRTSAAAIWFDAADTETVLVTDGIVSEVKNKGWAGGVFTPEATNASGSPTLAKINGRQAVWFDGTDDFLRTMAYTNSTPRKLYVYLVTQRGAYMGSAGFFSYTQIESDKNDDKQVGAVMAYAKSETSHGIVAGTVGTDYGTFDNSTGHTVIDVYSVGNYGVMFGQVDAERPYTATIATKNIHAVYPSDDDRATQNNLFQIGARKNGNDVPRWFWQGAIGEVLVFDAPLTVDQQIEMFDYLRAKWMGLPGSVEPPMWLMGRSSGANRGISLVQKSGTTVVQNGSTVELAAYEAETEVALARTTKWSKDAGALFAAETLAFDGAVELGFSPFPGGNRTLFAYGEDCTGFDQKAWSFAAGSRRAMVIHEVEKKQVNLVGAGLQVLVR